MCCIPWLFMWQSISVMLQLVMKGVHSSDIIDSFAEMIIRMMHKLPPDMMWPLR